MSIYDEHEGIVCFSLAYLSFVKVYDIILRTIIKIIGLDWRMRGEVNMGKIIGICISEKEVQKHLITEANIVCDWESRATLTVANGIVRSVFFPKKSGCL